MFVSLLPASCKKVAIWALATVPRSCDLIFLIFLFGFWQLLSGFSLLVHFVVEVGKTVLNAEDVHQLCAKGAGNCAVGVNAG